MKKLSGLKMVALALAGVAMLINNELQKREVRDIVNEELDKRDKQPNKAVVGPYS